MLGHRKLEISDYVAILKRRALLIAIPILVFPILSVGITFFLQPRFLSQTLILIDQQKVPDEYVRSVVSSDLDSRLSSMKEQILSRSRLQPIIEHYNLYGSSHMSMDDRIDAARKNIDIRAIHSEMSRTSGLPGFFISFTANDGRTAQAVCEEITSLFVSENVRSRQSSAEGTTDFIKGQLDDAKRSLDEQDAKLAAFQKEYVGKLPSEEMPNVNMLTSLNTQLQASNETLARMEQDRTYLQSMLSQLTPGTSPAGSSTAGNVPNARKDAKQNELRALEAQESDLAGRYTSDYPDVVAIRQKITDLRKQIAQMPDTVPAGSTNASTSRQESGAVLQLRSQLRSADSGIQAKRKEQEMLQAQVHLYQQRIGASPVVDQQYKQLTRDYETAKKFYEDLLGKMNQSKMATDLERRQEGEQFHVMDQPNLPDAPVFPKRAVFLAGGIVVGLAFGLGLAALLEYRDTALRTEHDVWTFTKLPTLAVISFAEDATRQSGGTYGREQTPRKVARRTFFRRAQPRDV